MIHNVILAACIAGAGSVVLIAVWTRIGNKIDSQGGFISGRLLPPTFSHRLSPRRRSPNVEVRTPTEKALPGGWSRIHLAVRMRRDIRIAAR
jgi:hypothetical protein